MMKYSLTISDLTADQVTELLNITKGEIGISSYDEEKVVQFPAPVAANASTELDVNGHVWDERVHASTKGKNKDGSWKRKRGVDDVEYANILSASSPAPTLPVVNVPAVPTMPAAYTPAIPAAALPPAAPVPAAPLPPVSVPTARDFAGLLTKISELFQAVKITAAYPQTIVDRINPAFGAKVQTISDIGNDPGMVEFAWQCLEVDGII